MRESLLSFFFIIITLNSLYASASKIQAVTLTPKGSLLTAGSFTIDLGEPDDVTVPTAWQGPLHITGLDGRSCTANDDIAIIEKPFVLQHNHFLYVSTYSGSHGRLFVVDARNCAVKWKSPLYIGNPIISGDRLVLPGNKPTLIGPDGMPEVAPLQ